MLLDDGWSVVTADGRLSAHFEHTIAVTDDGPGGLHRPLRLDPDPGRAGRLRSDWQFGPDRPELVTRLDHGAEWWHADPLRLWA